ncbi:hypothetical protein [Hymenobacter sp. 102]|uniref:hypothetical protein n=1 Tax=Hymenobacter sp. 102 TaxID=3403152 RepID=UPI003CF14AE4
MKALCLLLLLWVIDPLPVLAQRLPAAVSRSAVRAMQPLSRGPQATFSRPQQAVRYDWEPAQAAWTQPLLDRLTYTAQGQLAERITADSATATIFQRETFAYDAQGNLLENIRQTGNGSPWVNEFRYLSTYDARQQLTEQLTQAWVNGAWETTDGYRYVNTYTGPTLTEQVVRLFKAGIFVDDIRFRYQLGNGQWTEALAQRWNGTEWVNEERLLDLVWHDWNRQQPASFRVQSWQNTGQWTDFQRHTLSYSPTGTVVQLVEEASAGSWQNFMRYTEPVDAQGNSTGYRQEDWLNGIWVLTNELRAQLRYDAQNRLTRRTEQLYAPLLAQFVNQRRTNYSSFQTLTPTKSATLATRPLHLYPQPATDVLQLELDADDPAARPVTLEIRAATGQLVQQLSAVPRAGKLRLELPVHQLPPGWYSLRVRTRHGLLMRPFIRQ